MSEYYFAWIDVSETTFGVEHHRFDEDVLSVDISQDEGNEAAVTLEIRNPRIGLLGPGRQYWFWLAWRTGASVYPLGRYRLVGIPQDFRSDAIKIDGIARPIDVAAQKAALAATMRVPPYYDPLWLQPDKRLDDDTVLEGYSSLWHIDRVTHILTASSIILGEDGTINLNDDVYYDSVQSGLGANPVRRIDVKLNAGWGQNFAGIIDVAPLIKAAFGGTVNTYTGKALSGSWPSDGTGIGGGWEFYRSSPGVLQNNDKVQTPFGDVYPAYLPFWQIQFPLWKLNPTCEVAYTADRVRRESISFSIELGVQAILTETGEEEPVIFELGTEDVDQPIDPPDSDHPDGNIPIVDPARNIFFPTDRGIQAVENGMMLARAKMLKAARAVEVRGETSWQNGLSFSCRKSLSFLDPRLPGGGASGKITSYRLTADGDTGEKKSAFTIACCIGTGDSLVLADGEGAYVEDGVLEDGVQVVVGQENLLAGLDLAYTAFDNVTAANGGIDFSNVNAADFATVAIENPSSVQVGIVAAGQIAGLYSIGQVAEMLRAVPTRISLTMRPITGEDLTTQYTTILTELICPNGIDLEAT